jgi:hypothetical protein
LRPKAASVARTKYRFKRPLLPALDLDYNRQAVDLPRRLQRWTLTPAACHSWTPTDL